MLLKSSRRGVTFVDVLIVLGLSAIAIGLIFPVFNAARSASERMQAEEAAKQQRPLFYDDPDLPIDGSYEAILLYFYSSTSEVCKEQTPLIEKAAAAYKGRLKVVLINYLNIETNKLTLYDVHHTPTIIIRRKGEASYRVKMRMSEEELKSFIETSLSTPMEQR